MRKTFSSVCMKFIDITCKNLDANLPLIFVNEDLVEKSKKKIIKGRFVICNGIFDFIVDSEENVDVPSITKIGE